MGKRKKDRKRGTKQPLTPLQRVLMGKGAYRRFRPVGTVNHA